MIEDERKGEGRRAVEASLVLHLGQYPDIEVLGKLSWLRASHNALREDLAW